MTNPQSPMEQLTRRIINDRRIFTYGKNEANRLIAPSEMESLRSWLLAGDLSRAAGFLAKRAQALSPDPRSKKAVALAMRLSGSLSDHVVHLTRVCAILDDYGVLQCQLPAMDQYGTVVEREERTVVEQFFASKIQKADKPWNREALRRLMEHLAWGYHAGISARHLGFLVRKIDALIDFMEV